MCSKLSSISSSRNFPFLLRFLINKMVSPGLSSLYFSLSLPVSKQLLLRIICSISTYGNQSFYPLLVTVLLDLHDFSPEWLQ